MQTPAGDTVRYEYYSYTIYGKTRYAPLPTKIVYENGDSILNYYSQPLSGDPYYVQLDSTTNEEGRKTIRVYDSNHYLDSLILKDRNVAGLGVKDIVTNYDYNSVGNLLKVTDPEGRITYYEYNNNNNGPLLIEEGIDIGKNGFKNDDIRTMYSYDNQGRDTMIVTTRKGYDPRGSELDTTYFRYDNLGKIKEIEYPDGNYEEFVYDKAGNLIKKKEMEIPVRGSTVTTYEYSSYPSGDLRKVIEYEGDTTYTTTYGYNQNRRLVKFTNANGKLIEYKYNDDNLVSVHYPDTTTDSLGYSSCCGELYFKKDRKGEVIEYIYDERHRLIKKRFYDNMSGFGSNNPKDSIMYEYNKVGELTKTKDKEGDVIYIRDDVGSIDTLKVYSKFNSVYKYDKSGFKTNYKAYEAGDTTNVYIKQSWQSDDAGRAKQTTVDNKTWELSYYDNNTLKEIKYPIPQQRSGRLKEVYDIGSRGEILKIHGTSVSQPDSDFSLVQYGYDKRLRRDYQYIKLPDASNETMSYRYDNIARLDSIYYNQRQKAVEYEYDAVGNRLKKKENGSVVATYNYNKNNNRLISITQGNKTFGYNDRGDLTSRSGGYTYQYDREARMKRARHVYTRFDRRYYKNHKYIYTPEGRRFRKIYHWGWDYVIGKGRGSENADTTYYVYDGIYVVAETDEDYNLDKKYIYANGVLLGQINKNGKLFQYFHDGLGSIVAIYDSTGTYKNLYMYDEFGKFLKKSQSVSNKYYYTGQEQDGVPTNFYNLRARYYYPDIGRFTQEDPLLGSEYRNSFPLIQGVFPQDFNPYPYCVNNPINMIDPEGLWRLLIIKTNWCGDRWTGGLHKWFEEMTPQQRATLKPPLSNFDRRCMKHDHCYYQCRKKYERNTTQYRQCIAICNRDF
jgi:RHS repeat-associated protein